MRFWLSSVLYRLYRWSLRPSSPLLESKTVGNIKVDTFANGSIEYSSTVATYPAVEAKGAIGG